MAKSRKQPSERLVRFAVEDFGTAHVPIDLRRRARLEAFRLGITPRQALDRIRARAEARRARRKSRAAAPQPGNPGAPSKAPARRPKVLSVKVRTAEARGQLSPSRPSGTTAGVSTSTYVRFVQGGLPSLGKRR